MKTLITFSLQAEAWLVKQCVNRGIQCLLQPRGVNRSQQGQGLPAPRLPVPLWQTKLPLSLPSAQSWRTIVIIAPLPHSAALLNTALLLCDSPVSSMLLNSIFCDKVGTRLSVYFQKSSPRGNNSDFPLFGHLSCWQFVMLQTKHIFN